MARILLVDDDDLVGEAVRLQLEAGGHDVTLARHGGDGLKAFGQASFDLVISDIFMPEVEGVEFILSLRRQDRDVPIIAMSGGAARQRGASDEMGADYLRMARKLGATRTIAKPFTRQALMTLVGECLAGSDSGTQADD